MNGANSMAAQAAAQRGPRQSGGGRYSTWNTYFSTINFPFAVAGTFTYTVSAGTSYKAFSYGIGQDMAIVGFPTSTPATNADTNLQKANETQSGEMVRIYGISLLPTSDSDAFLTKIIWPNLSVSLVMNGSQIQRLGTPEFIPGAGGLTGFGDSYVQAPSQLESFSRSSGALTNGLAQVSNFKPFPEPIVWNPSGQMDSTLNIAVTCERNTIATTLLAADRAAQAAGANTSGAAPWVHPTGTAIGTYVKIKVLIHSRQDGARSQNM